MPRRLFTVNETYYIRGRGVIPLPGFVPVGDERFRVGDPLRLKRPDGSELHTVIGGIDYTSPQKGDFPILLAGLSKEDVPVGTEVWSVDR